MWHLVEVTEFPEKHQQLLMKLDFLAGMGQVCLQQGVIEQPADSSQDQMKILHAFRKI